MELLNVVVNIKVQNCMAPLALSQTYLRKAQVIADFITTCSVLNTYISDPDLLNGLKRRINQQKSNSSSCRFSFLRKPSELMTFSCENNTKLTWDQVFDSLTDMQNSNNKTFTADISELMNIALTNTIEYSNSLKGT